MKKVLITVGAGFIGYHLACKLFKSGYQVDLLDNFSRGVKDAHLEALAKNESINLVNSNLLDAKLVYSIDQDYDYIYHLAAIIVVKHVLKSPYSVLDNNLILLQNSIAIARKQKGLKRFVFASTSEVYAGTLHHYGLEFPTIETTPLTVNDLNNERTSYMLSKIYGEALCLHSGLPVTIIRPHNFYGPRMGLSHVIPELMKKIIDIESDMIDVYSANHKRTFCFIADGVQMIQSLAESKHSQGEVYNVGNEDEEVAMQDLAERIITLLGKNVKVNPLPPTKGSPERRCPSIAKLKNVISFSKQYSLADGINETYNWYKENIFSGIEVSAV